MSEGILTFCAIVVCVNVHRTKDKDDKWDPFIYAYWNVIVFSIVLYFYDLYIHIKKYNLDTCELHPYGCAFTEIMFAIVNLFFMRKTYVEYKEFKIVGVMRRPEGYHRPLKKEREAMLASGKIQVIPL